MKKTKATKDKLKFMSSVQQTYIQMVANKTIKKSIYVIALLSAFVSPTNGPSQSFLACTL